MRRYEFEREITSRLENETEQRHVVLAVGDLSDWVQDSQENTFESHVAFVTFDDLNNTMFDLLAPTIVLSPVITEHFDCIELAERLFEFGYQGQFHVIGDGLPEPDLIRREIQEMCPGLNFDIVDMAHDRSTPN